MFLEISLNSQDNTCARISFLIKLQALICKKKRYWHKCFHVNFAKFLRTPFLAEHLWWLLPGSVFTTSQTLLTECFGENSYVHLTVSCFCKTSHHKWQGLSLKCVRLFLRGWRWKGQLNKYSEAVIQDSFLVNLLVVGTSGLLFLNFVHTLYE